MTTDIRFTTGTKLSDSRAPDEAQLLVKRAAAELLAEGTPPTAASIRVRIGTEVSAAVINDALHEWWQELSRRLAATRFRTDQSQSLIDTANEYATTVAPGADTTTDHENATKQKAKAQEEIRIERERRMTLLQDHIRQVEAQLKSERALQATTQKQLREELNEQKAALSKFDAKYKEETATWREEKAKLIKVGQKLHQRVKQTQEQIVTLQKQLVSANDERSTLLEQIQMLRSENIELQAQITHQHTFEETLRDDLKSEITVDPTRVPPRRRT